VKSNTHHGHFSSCSTTSRADFLVCMCQAMHRHGSDHDWHCHLVACVQVRSKGQLLLPVGSWLPEVL